MKDPTTISFPGLGIEPFTVDKVLFSIGDLEVRWYGALITLGIICAFLYAVWRGKRNERIVLDDVIDIAMVTVVCGVVGARLYYVLTSLERYETFFEAIAIWNGGLAIYGGIIGGCFGMWLMCRIKKIKWRRLFDMAAPGVMIAQAIGRWGNFFNGEAHGFSIGEYTAFHFWNTEHVLEAGEGSFYHAIRMGVSNSVRDPVAFYHPTFLYECLWNVLGFVLINLFYKHKKYDGQIALLYFTWYGFGRVIVEGFRDAHGDSLYIPGTTLRISQCLGMLCFVAGLALLLVLFFRKYSEPVFVTTAKTDGTESMPIKEENTTEAVASSAQEDYETEVAPTEKNMGEDAPTNPESEETENGNVD